jgi:predicted nucleotidyltransferase
MSSAANILKSFTVRDSLNSEIWILSDNEPKMKPEIRQRLLEIAYEFFEFLDIDVFVDDIIMTGSLANFNWSKYSDVDMHLIVDFSQFPEEVKELYEKLFNLKKLIFNENHDIKIKNFEVELYVQDSTEEHTSSGVYSILYDNWIVEPDKVKDKIDKKFLMTKVKSWMNKIDEIMIDAKDSEDLESSKKILEDFKEKLKDYRKAGLDKEGEFSYENLVFKFLRRNGYIEKLFDFENQLIDNKLSMKERTTKN